MIRQKAEAIKTGREEIFLIMAVAKSLDKR